MTLGPAIAAAQVQEGYRHVSRKSKNCYDRRDKAAMASGNKHNARQDRVSDVYNKEENNGGANQAEQVGRPMIVTITRRKLTRKD